MISMDKTYKTRNGKPVRLLCTDAGGSYPVIGLVNGEVYTWASDGSYYASIGDHRHDLIEEVTVVCQFFYNIYLPDEYSRTGVASAYHKSRVEANHSACCNRIGVMTVTHYSDGNFTIESERLCNAHLRPDSRISDGNR